MADDSDCPGTYRVLFLCTGNSARSILAEAALGHLDSECYRSYSAGSHPWKSPHPMALEVLASLGIDTRGLRSKSWDEFASLESPKMDFIFTVCDEAAGEACPVWPGQPTTAHWGVRDPASFEGSTADQIAFFLQTYHLLAKKIEAFVSLDPTSLSSRELSLRLDRIGEG